MSFRRAACARRRSRSWRRAALIGGASASRRQELRITHLNVGQGDAAVVELPGSKVLLIDAGGTATSAISIRAKRIVAPFLRSRKILKVDYLVVSHPRIDHYGGMRTIVNEFAPKEFWSGAAQRPDPPLRGSGGDAGKIANHARCFARRRSHAESSSRSGFASLYPPTERADEGSVVMRLEYGKFRAYLFAGDIDKRDEALLAQHASTSFAARC